MGIPSYKLGPLKLTSEALAGQSNLHAIHEVTARYGRAAGTLLKKRKQSTIKPQIQDSLLNKQASKLASTGLPGSGRV
eukprot:1156841-Pelagomonas_calceolata.AAC.5